MDQSRTNNASEVICSLMQARAPLENWNSEGRSQHLDSMWIFPDSCPHGYYGSCINNFMSQGFICQITMLDKILFETTFNSRTLERVYDFFRKRGLLK